MVKLLVVMSILSVLSYTEIGGFIATMGMVIIIGIPVTFALYALPTLTLAGWILFLSKKIIGRAWPGAALLAALVAVHQFWLGPWVDQRAAETVNASERAGLPEIPASGIIAIQSRNNLLGDKQRWSRKFGPAFKVDRMKKDVIQNEETKEPFA